MEPRLAWQRQVENTNFDQALVIVGMLDTLGTHPFRGGG